MKKQLTFYFDYISPFSFLSWFKIIKLCEKYDLELIAEPIVFGAVLSALGTKGPVEIESKRIYTYKDVLRSANKDSMKIVFPPTHPFNSLLSLRATCLLANTDHYHNFITDVFLACWSEGKDLNDKELINSLLGKYGFTDGLEKCGEAEIKKVLKDKTDKAINKGIFGVPSFVVDDEIFWGNDRFEFLENYLLGKDPVTKENHDSFVSLKKGVERKI